MTRRKISSRRRSRRNASRRRARVSALPPLVPFNKTMSNAVFRSSHDHDLKPDTYLSLVFRTQTLVSGYPQIVAAFKELKIIKVCVWAYTSLPTTATGTLTMIVCPIGLAQKNSTAKLAAAAPGAITRKVWQCLHGVYFPTEPSERDWIPIDTQHLVFDLEFFPWQTAANKEENAVSYPQLQIIVDAHVLLRGQRNGVQGIPPVARTMHYDDLAKSVLPGPDPSPDIVEMSTDHYEVPVSQCLHDAFDGFEKLDLDSSPA